GGGAGIGLAPGALAQLYQRVRFLGTDGEHAARPVVFEAAPQQPHAVGEQQRCQGVAFVARVLPAIERHRERTLAVDRAARRQETGLSRLHSGRSSLSPGKPVAAISWLTVWRSTCTNWRQPLT